MKKKSINLSNKDFAYIKQAAKEMDLTPSELLKAAVKAWISADKLDTKVIVKKHPMFGNKIVKAVKKHTNPTKFMIL